MAGTREPAQHAPVVQRPAQRECTTPSRVSPCPPLDAAAVLALQRTAGNQAIGRWLARQPVAQSPVLYALDAAGKTYMSVAVPGHTAADVAAYLYETPDGLERLHAANPGIGEFLPAGTRLHEGQGKVSHAAWKDFNDARRGGTLMRGEGAAQSGGGNQYRFTAGGREFVLTEGQYQGMLRGAAAWMAKKASFLVGRADNGLEGLKQHAGTNAAVRGLSDWMGHTESPDGQKYRVSRQLAQRIIDESNDPTAETVRHGVRWLEIAAQTLDVAEEEWREYIGATIAGAAEMSHRLSLVRDTAFGIAAGLAGAAAVPFAVAAAASAGGVASGAAGATLEAAGAAAGEGLSTLAGPGAEFDLDYVKARAAKGGKSGAVSGALGAAGQFAMPKVTGALAERLVARGVPPTIAQRLMVQGASGAIVGAPSGAVSAALENAGALARGEISLDEYQARVAGGLVSGGATGGVLGMLGGLRSKKPVADDDWSALNEGLGLTPPTPRNDWTLPGTWKQAKPEAYRLIFGTKTLPDINRPGQIKMTLGHIVEKSTGGAHALDNLMPQLNAVNVKLSGIYGAKTFRLPQSAEVVTSLNGKQITGSLREAFASGVFDLEEQRAISNYLTSLVIAENPAFEQELADLVRRIPALAQHLD